MTACMPRRRFWPLTMTRRRRPPESGEEGDEEQEGQEKMDLPPRKCIIFCPENDRDRLFEEVDRKNIGAADPGVSGLCAG